MDERLLTVREVSELLNVDEETVRNWLRRGILKGYKISAKEWRVNREDVRSFLEQRSNTPKEQ